MQIVIITDHRFIQVLNEDEHLESLLPVISMNLQV